MQCRHPIRPDWSNLHTADEIEEALAHCTGTEGYYVYQDFYLTDGVEMLCRMAECFWLIDVLAAYQEEARKDDMLQSIQFWTLTVKDGVGELVCERDTNDVAFKAPVPHTDFPLDTIRLWVAPGGTLPVVMLPSEY